MLIDEFQVILKTLTNILLPFCPWFYIYVPLMKWESIAEEILQDKYDHKPRITYGGPEV